MARASKSHRSNEENMRTPDGLEPPYSSRVDGHRYVLYCSLRKDNDPYGRTLVLKFLATYAARFFIKKLIRDDEFEWCKWMDRDWMLTTSTGISIRCAGNQLREIMDYVPSPKENEWTDEQLIASINRFRYGRHEAAAANDGLVEHRTEGADGPEENREKLPDAKKRKAKRDPKPDRLAREPKPNVDLSGHVSANDIAKNLGVIGREVRGILRALKLEKPDHGWSWPRKEAIVIEARVKAELKKGKKK